MVPVVWPFHPHPPPTQASFFNNALQDARDANLSSRNRTVLDIQELQKFLSQVEALQAVIAKVKVSRSIDDLLDGVYAVRGISQDRWVVGCGTYNHCSCVTLWSLMG